MPNNREIWTNTQKRNLKGKKREEQSAPVIKFFELK